MTDLRLREIIRELQRELEGVDRAIAVMERMAGPRRGRPRKRPLPVARLRRGPAKR